MSNMEVEVSGNIVTTAESMNVGFMGFFGDKKKNPSVMLYGSISKLLLFFVSKNMFIQVIQVIT